MMGEQPKIGDIVLSKAVLKSLCNKTLCVKQKYSVDVKDYEKEHIKELAESEAIKLSSKLQKGITYYVPLEKRGVFTKMEDGSLAAWEKSFFDVEPNSYDVGEAKNGKVEITIYFYCKANNPEKIKELLKKEV